MSKTEAHKRNLRHSRKRAVGFRRYYKPEMRALKELQKSQRT